MKHALLILMLVSVYSLALAQVAPEEAASQLRHGAGDIATPHSGIARPDELGLRSHTLFKILVPPGRSAEPGFPVEPVEPFSRPAASTPSSPVPGYWAETPASLACLYGLVPTTAATAACNVQSASAVATGGAKAIAIVDAYDYPTALADLTAYSKQFGLAAPASTTFTVAYQGPSRPLADPDCSAYGGWSCWSAEAALDIEMAHSMAPSAHIYLVEANSNSNADLYAAVKKAVSLVQVAGGGEVSMSWGGGEYSTETNDDATFTGANVVFFASSGDGEGTIYPSVSPNVVAVGGTTITRNPSTLAFEAEVTWEDTGGGLSIHEPRPPFQSAISSAVGTHRGVPDVAAIGNPRTGVWVYDSYQNTYSGTLYPWNIFGGTSVASPLWAGIVNHAGHFSASTSAEETLVYSNAKTAANFRDVVIGTCGYYEGYFAAAGWDPCSGNGVPLGSTGK